MKNNLISDDIFVLVNDERMYLKPILKNYYIVAFSTKEIMRDEVNDLFLKVSSQTVLDYGKNIEESTMNLINTFLPHQIIVAKKVHALLSLGEQWVEKELANIFKQGYNRYFRLRGEADDFSIMHLFNKMDTELDGTIFIPAFLYYEWNYTDKIGARIFIKKIEEFSIRKSLTNIEATVIRHILFNLAKQESDAKQREEKGKLDDLEKKRALKRFSDLFNFRLDKSIEVDKLLVEIEGGVVKDLIKKDKSFEMKIRKGTNFDDVYKHPIYIDFKRLCTLPYILGKDELNLMINATLTREDYFYFYSMFMYSVKKERLEDTDKDFQRYFAEYLLAFSYDKALKLIEKAMESNELSRLSVEKERIKIKEDSKLIQEEKSALKKEKLEMQQQGESLEQRNERLLKEIHELQRKLAQKESELESYQDLKKEVVALREEVFSQQTEDKNEDEIDNKVYEFNVVYFGGHPNTILKLRNMFPNLRHVPAESLSVDLSFVRNMDICIFDKTYNNHSNYNRFKEIKADVPVVYIDGGTSVGTVLRKIKEKLKK